MVWATLVCVLVIAFAVVSLPWWVPAAFQRWIPVMLEKAGFSEAELALGRFGQNGVEIRLVRIRYQGLTVSDGELAIRYNLKDLWRGEVEEAVIKHPTLEIDLSEGFTLGGAPESGSDREQLGRSLPIEALKIVDAVVTLRGDAWSRVWELDAEFAVDERLRGNANLRGAGVELKAEAEALWPDLTGRAKASVRIEEPAAWLNFGRERDWFTLPEAHSLESGPLDGEVSAVFEHRELNGWEMEWSTGQLDGSVRNARLSVQNLEISTGGKGAQVNYLEAAAINGGAGYEAMDLDFGRFNAASRGTEEIELSLSEWALKGAPPVDGLGSISLATGPLRLQVEGDWRVWQHDFSTEQLRANLLVAKGPLAFFSALGSATGSLQMDADLSANVPRRLTLSGNLSDSDLTASGINLKSKQVKASIEGAVAGSLEAGVEVEDGQLSWSDGAGLLKGLEGKVQLASIRPPATKGRQRFQFASIKQGDFKTGSGRLAFSYPNGPEAGEQLELECAADALGGRVRIVSKGRVAPPRSLALRVYLERVALAQVAALFPQFDGEIEGMASGELALRLEDQRLVLEPGRLQLTPDTVGRFAYTQQGWLTQDTDLNPQVFVEDRDIVNIMKDSRGASVITELAMRDLAMTEFTLSVLERDSAGERIAAQIRGHSTVKGVKVPVVLDVPIRGDVKETVNAVFKLNAQR